MQGFIRIRGSCHCGNIRLALLWPESDAVVPVRECGCTFCRKHSGAWTSNQSASLSIEIEDPSSVSKYRFGTKTADFHVCSKCGVVPVVVSELGEEFYAVVNVNSLDGVTDLSFSSSSTDFDGENVSSRLNRRKRNWIPGVKISTAL